MGAELLTDTVISTLVQLPIVALFVWVVFRIQDKNAQREKDRDALFAATINAERESRELQTDKTNHTLTGLTTGVGDLNSAVTELRTEVRRASGG